MNTVFDFAPLWRSGIGFDRLFDVVEQALKFEPTDKTIESVSVDLTRLHELAGPTKVDWHDGFRRMVAARHPELLG